jgi:hypothetical protein
MHERGETSNQGNQEGGEEEKLAYQILQPVPAIRARKIAIGSAMKVSTSGPPVLLLCQSDS